MERRVKVSYVLATLLACLCQLTASLTITLPDPVLEGTNLTITCTTSGAGAGTVRLLVNGQDSGITGVIHSDTTMRVFDYGTVDRSNSGTMFQCLDTFDNSMSDVATLDVQWPPSFALSVPSGSVLQFIEGSSQEVMVQGLDLGRPAAVGVEWSVNGVGLTSGGGVTVSDSGIAFSDVRRSQSGVYSARLSNVHANVTANFTVDVIYPPTFGDRPPTEVQLELSHTFVFNCTPVPGNPDEGITFRKAGSPVTPGPSITVDGPLLTIPSVQRSDSGNYSCTASNTAGMATVYYALAVVVPPGTPENLAFPSIGPFSVTVTWSPPSDNGGTPDTLNYTVALTTTSNGQSVSTTQTTQMQSSFTSLSHSVNYTVSIVAINSLGQQGQPAVGTFRTNDIPPVVGSVAAVALSLSEVQVTVTVSDTGGQPVEEYTVTINGKVVMFNGSADLQLIGNVTGLALMNGVTYSVSVVARNSVGPSRTYNSTFVPFPPNATMQPVAVPLIIGVMVAVVIVFLLTILIGLIVILVWRTSRGTKGEHKKKPKKEPINGDEDLEMMGARSEDPLAPQYEDPDSLSRKPPSAVTYKKAEEAVDTQPNPSGVMYADLDFSRQQTTTNKKVAKRPEAKDPVVYSEVHLMTPQEWQQLREQESGVDEEPHSPTAMM